MSGDLGAITDVHLARDHHGGAELPGDLVEPGLIDVGDRQPRAAGRERRRRRTSDAGAGPGDDGHFLCQYIHLQLPSCCVGRIYRPVPHADIRFLRSQPACGYAC